MRLNLSKTREKNMLKRRPLNPPQDIYPLDPWQIIEKEFSPRFLAQTETIFSLGNGYLGMRGCFEEGTPVFENGTFINAFYEIWPICYGEEAPGFAKEGQTIVNVPDIKIIKLLVDDEPFVLTEANLISFQRTLDLRAGTLNRDVLWELPSGKRVSIKSRRLVSYEHRHLAAIAYEVTVLNADAQVTIISEMRNKHEDRLRQNDTRLHQNLKGKVLLPLRNSSHDQRVILAHKTENSELIMACGIAHLIETADDYSVDSESSEDEGKVIFACQGQSGQAIKITKFIAYHTSQALTLEELGTAVGQTLDLAKTCGFDDLLKKQRLLLDDFWQRSDIQIEGDPEQPHHRAGELQQAIRFNLFQIFQATIRLKDVGIPAKGLTGQAYDGNYFWDTEIYLLPFLIYSYPQVARNLLEFRYKMLDKARQRAEEVGEQGALFPWRTIDGEEASAYYAAGTAQYHIDGDLMYALQHYVEVTGDQEFLFGNGAEMLVETARMWHGLGFFSDRREGKFCLHGVTGPDEYTTVVDNNLYTNLIAQNNLSYAADTLKTLQENDPGLYDTIVDKTGLNTSEIDNWRRAAELMCLPYDAELGIHPQDDSFLGKDVWDFEHTPTDHYPLLLHYHPLKIYRKQVIKQADVALAMFLLGDKFSSEQKRRNFDYYDPLTTGDSSLSACIESIIALEVGYLDKALEYAHYAVLMDLEDIDDNVKDGCHMASMGGSWMLCVYGFGGLRDYGGVLAFNPRLPKGLQRLHFPLNQRGQALEVNIEPETTTYLLREGSGLTIRHRDQELNLYPGRPVSIQNCP
jgi:alpha,alpha-trehalose phosphorylase